MRVRAHGLALMDETGEFVLYALSLALGSASD